MRPAPEMIVLPEIQDLADDVRRGRPRRAMRRPRTIAQACLPVLVEAPFPFVERFPRDAEVAAGARDIALVGRSTQQAPPPGD